MKTRRHFLKSLVLAIGTIILRPKAFALKVPLKKPMNEIHTSVFRSVNGSPRDNLIKVLGMMGGIEHFVSRDDIVIIKPNIQWWNQGAPNISTLKAFVDLIMGRSGGFSGEVVMAENCHRGPRPWTAEHSGWVHRFERNSDLPGIANLNDLSKSLKRDYGDRFTTYHLIDVDLGVRRVYGPEDGEGYVYCDGTGGVPLISCGNGCREKDFRAVIMSYPIIQTDRGSMIDFKNGIWEKGAYTEQPLKLINFAALNHHSTYCGATSAVKNYLGIADLSGGSDPDQNGKLTDKYHNFHSFPFNKWSPGPVSGMLGKEIAVFMETIRRADLNITTAEWTGLASRTDPPVARTRAVLASTDPVALDYHAFKYVLHPNSKASIHNPDDRKSPVYEYLRKCAEEGGGVFDEKHVDVKSFDFEKNGLQDSRELMLFGEKDWGTNPKIILKYLLLRYVIR